MITRRIIGLVLLGIIILVGIILYFVVKRRFSYIESDMSIRTKEQIK